MRPTSLVAAAFLTAGLSPATTAQLADLQPGRNFTAQSNFGSTNAEGIDGGDADLDGDIDVVTANGAWGSAQLPRIFINDGLGSFADETSTRFAGFPTQHSRDVDFVDVENDGDLDVFLANDKPGATSSGEVSRFFVNLGGSQSGAAGFYQEASDDFWGSLVSVPLAAQIFGGNAGPFNDWSCDCDFGDLDDDGDSDLFFSTYGPGIDGSHDSRIFLNDGAGVFNELWPWADPGADTKTHTINMSLADLDGDFDVDVFMSSRNTQARVYLNNQYGPVGPAPFQDITQHALLDTGAPFSGFNAYDCELADVDGDGDFDAWMNGYNNNLERLLRNDGPDAGGFSFSQMDDWIAGDPNLDEEDSGTFGDYDNDGDLDNFVPSFSGTNYLYQSRLAQEVMPHGTALLYRTGLATGLAPAPELPSNYNSGSSADGDWYDVDGDGDLDILLANNANQGNWLFRNVLGVPDTHAPSFEAVTVQGDKPNGTDAVIHAAVRDNAPMQLFRFFEATLVYTVNGGVPQSLAMFHQGGQQYRGAIPAQTNATVEYHIEVTDLAGNSGVSQTHNFEQGTVGAEPWTDLGNGLAGVAGIPALVGTGPLTAGSAGALTLTNAAPSSVCALFVSLSSAPAPFKCGTLVPVPVALQLTLVTNGSGALPLAWGSWPNGLSGASLYFQYAIADGAAVCGTALSNAVRADVP